MQPTFSRLQLWLLAVSTALVIIVGIVYFVPSVRTNVSNWIAFAFAPEDVQHMLFLSGSDENHLGLSSVRFGFISTITYPDKTFVEEISRKGNITAILRDLSTGSTDVYAVEKKEGKALTTDGRQKQDLTVSPDNALVAFSYVNAPSTEVAAGTADIARYELAVVNRSTGEVREYGNGAYPHFIDANTLFFVSSKGFVVKNLGTGVEDVLPDEMASRVLGAPLFLTSSSVAIWNSVVEQYDIFNIVMTDPLNLSVVRSVPEFGKDIDAVTANEQGAFFALTDDRTVLRKADEATTTALFRFPGGFIPQDISSAL